MTDEGEGPVDDPEAAKKRALDEIDKQPPTTDEPPLDDVDLEEEA